MKHHLTPTTDDLPLAKMSQISERWLMEIGGWAAMKAARGLLAGGSVELSECGPGLVRGKVGSGKTQLMSGLRFRSGSDVDNLCTCPTARRSGQICEHALAVGLASLRKGQASVHENRSEGHLNPVKASGQVGVPKKGNAAPGRWLIYMPDSWFKDAHPEGRPLTVFLQWEVGVNDLQQERLHQWLTERGVALQSSALSLSDGDMPSWLECLIDCPNVFRGKPQAGAHWKIQVTEALARPRLQVSISVENGVCFTLLEKPAPICLSPLASQKPWLFHENEDLVHPLGHISSDEGTVLAAELVHQRRPVLRSIRWLAEYQEDLGDAFDLLFDAELSQSFSVQNVTPEWCLRVGGSLQEIEVSLWGSFQDCSWEVTLGATATSPGLSGKGARNTHQEASESIFPIQDQRFKNRFYVRDLDLEREVVNGLIRRGLVVDGISGRLKIRSERDVLRFYASTLPILEEEFRVQIEPSLMRLTQGLQRIAPMVRMEDFREDSREMDSAGDWLSMEYAYVAPDGFRLSRADALRMVRTGQSMVKSPNGKRYVLDLAGCEELEDVLRDVPFEVNVKGGSVSRGHAHYLLPFIERKALARMEAREVDSRMVEERVGNLFTTLRSYQVTGVGWLLQRLEKGKGALLADDMGLGKTLQCIAAIRCRLLEAGSGNLALVVCPKSLLTNWEMEFDRFAPELRVLVMQGAKRAENFKTFSEYQVILTSYPLLVRDLESYQSRHFQVVVADEASFIRNPATDVAKAVCGLQAEGRIALSGTPVENRVRDLWSIFQFILPGYLGNPERFRERFEKPMEAGDRVRVADRLRRLVKPYVLRRTKREVLTELPGKVEQILWCEMSSVQGEVYRRLLEEGREEMRDARRQGQVGRARMTMFTVLLRLRQACCDVRLLKLPAATMSRLSLDEFSGKWAIWQERLEEAIVGGGKVLVFSQFVSYLQIARDILDGSKITYSYLDGGTRDRGEAVKNFQNDADCRVFLISLKAGGYGLNLTQADHVILMDPWWNPAVEAQAIDRAHRFGQQRVVTAGRLVMRGTVEERILALQEKKRHLIASAVDEGSPLMEGLSDSELEELLAE